MLHAAGPLGSSIFFEPEARAPHGGHHEANGQIVLRRIAWLNEQDAVADNKQARVAFEAVWRRYSNQWEGRPMRRLVEAAATRRKAALRRLAARGRCVEEMEAKPVWRAIVGLGDEVPQETGMRLHGTYGVPILPGQSLKGLAAAEAAQDPDPDKAEWAPIVMGRPRPGGDPATAALGKVTFLDALPTRIDTAMDVMTPHVSEYYEQDLPPAEYWQPNPVSFLVLGPRTTFHIDVISKAIDAELVDLATQWLRKGLTERGVGAKTSAGYGYLSVPDGD